MPFPRLQLHYRKKLITLSGSKYVVANLVQKRDSDKYIVHIVNYHRPVKNIRVTVNLTGLVESVGEIAVLSPDATQPEIINKSYKNNILTLTLDELDIYALVTLN
jgi:hypothetical protein